MKLEVEELTNALNSKNEEVSLFDFESVAKAVEHFTYTDHTGRTAAQVIRDMNKGQ